MPVIVPPIIRPVISNPIYGAVDDDLAYRGGGFRPSDIAFREVWYTAQDISTITKDGSNVVSEWRNKFDITTKPADQITAPRQPTYTQVALNGKPAITGDGSDFLDTTMTLDSSTNGGFTIVINASHDIGASYAVLFDSYHALGRLRLFRAGIGGTTRLKFIYGASGGATTPTGALVPTSNRYKLLMRCRNGLQELFLLDPDDTLDPSTPSDSLTEASDVVVDSIPAIMSIAASPGSFWTGEFGELIAYDKWVTDAELVKLSKYSKKRWG